MNESFAFLILTVNYFSIFKVYKNLVTNSFERKDKMKTKENFCGGKVLQYENWRAVEKYCNVDKICRKIKKEHNNVAHYRFNGEWGIRTKRWKKGWEERRY
jgi:hypothetical protein